jgi:hypothetical protein
MERDLIWVGWTKRWMLGYRESGAVDASSPDALGVVRNLPGGVAGATFHLPVVLARAVFDIPDDPEHGSIRLGGDLKLSQVPRRRRVERVEPSPEKWLPGNPFGLLRTARVTPEGNKEFGVAY